MTTFDYPTTLCTVHRSRGYYDCVWGSHVIIAAPATIYQQETVPVSKCAIMELTGIFRDSLTQVKHQLNHSLETNYFATSVVGSLIYKKGHAHSKGSDASIGGEHMMSLFVTENLEVTVKTVMV